MWRGVFQNALGWTLDRAFSDEDCECFILSEAIYLMLLSREKFQAISAKPMVLPSDGVTSLLALSCGTRAEVDLMTEAAIVAWPACARRFGIHVFLGV
jgi:predicted lactoylglutathione lyase